MTDNDYENNPPFVLPPKSNIIPPYEDIEVAITRLWKWVIQHVNFLLDQKEVSVNYVKDWCQYHRTKRSNETPFPFSFGKHYNENHCYIIGFLTYLWCKTRNDDYLKKYQDYTNFIRVLRKGKQIKKWPEIDFWFEENQTQRRRKNFKLTEEFKDVDLVSIAHASKWLKENLSFVTIEEIHQKRALPDDFLKHLDKGNPKYKKSGSRDYVLTMLTYAMNNCENDLAYKATVIYHGFNKWINRGETDRKNRKNEHLSIITNINISDCVKWINDFFEIHTRNCYFGCHCGWPSGLLKTEYHLTGNVINKDSEVNKKLRFAYAWMVLGKKEGKLGIEFYTQQRQLTDKVRYKKWKNDPLKAPKMRSDNNRSQTKRRNEFNPIIINGVVSFKNKLKARMHNYNSKIYRYKWEKVWKRIRDRNTQDGINLTITEEEAKFLCEQSCAYCDFPPILPQKYNGLDRFDNNFGYSFDNCLPCCVMCNWMKSNHTFEEFLQQCINISIVHRKDKIAFINLTSEYSLVDKCGSMNWTRYQRRFKTSEFETDLDEQDFSSLTLRNCYYCGVESSLTPSQTVGLDRIDSEKGYLKTNIVPCCAICNRMKLFYSQTEFIEKCLKIVLFFFQNKTI